MLGHEHESVDLHPELLPHFFEGQKNCVAGARIAEEGSPLVAAERDEVGVSRVVKSAEPGRHGSKIDECKFRVKKAAHSARVIATSGREPGAPIVVTSTPTTRACRS